MSSCERCWREANLAHPCDVADEYARLVKSRTCTPEQQAGDDATVCPLCDRRAVHEITRECMACHGVQL